MSPARSAWKELLPVATGFTLLNAVAFERSVAAVGLPLMAAAVQAYLFSDRFLPDTRDLRVGGPPQEALLFGHVFREEARPLTFAERAGADFAWRAGLVAVLFGTALTQFPGFFLSGHAWIVLLATACLAGARRSSHFWRAILISGGAAVVSGWGDALGRIAAVGLGLECVVFAWLQHGWDHALWFRSARPRWRDGDWGTPALRFLIAFALAYPLLPHPRVPGARPKSPMRGSERSSLPLSTSSGGQRGGGAGSALVGGPGSGGTGSPRGGAGGGGAGGGGAGGGGAGGALDGGPGSGGTGSPGDGAGSLRASDDTKSGAGIDNGTNESVGSKRDVVGASGGGQEQNNWSTSGGSGPGQSPRSNVPRSTNGLEAGGAEAGGRGGGGSTPGGSPASVAGRGWQPPRLPQLQLPPFAGWLRILIPLLLVGLALALALVRRKGDARRTAQPPPLAPPVDLKTINEFSHRLAMLEDSAPETDLVVEVYNEFLHLMERGGCGKPADATADEYASGRGEELMAATGVFCAACYGKRTPSQEAFRLFLRGIRAACPAQDQYPDASSV